MPAEKKKAFSRYQMQAMFVAGLNSR